MSPQTFKHFRILELLGKGGMGEVYLALDTTLERKVALKFLPRDLLRDPSAQGRLLDEARSASRVQHPNIATVHSIEEDGGIYALCMEYVDGATLKQLIGRGPLSLNQITRIGADTAAGLGAAHEQGMVHRDIKPANVMITRRGEVKVMDFGLAVRPERVVNTLGPNTYGTVQYMSPEQAQGLKLGPASDIFSLGSLLYEAITGRAPFNASNDLATLQSIINAQPEPLRELRRNVPPALEQVVRGCLAKDPDQRWASMKDIAAELQYVEPTVEAGPRDLISELSIGLSGAQGAGHHRPDNAGSVGRRTGNAPADAENDRRATGPRSLDSIGPDLPSGVVVHDVVERPRNASKGSRLDSQGAPVGMVLGPEVRLDGAPSRGSDAFAVRSTRDQWQDHVEGRRDALGHDEASRRQEIAREAARRARSSKPVRSILDPDPGTSHGPHSVEVARLSARRHDPRSDRTSPLTLIVPALIALLVVAVAGYALLARIGAVPPPAELLGTETTRAVDVPAETADAAVGEDVRETAKSPEPPKGSEAESRVDAATGAVGRAAAKASSMLHLDLPDRLRRTLSAHDSTRADAARAVEDSTRQR